MYPTSPTIEQWRLAAAKMAKANGVPVPDWFDGTMPSIQKLNTDGKTDINAAITWMQNAYVVQNPGDFPPATLEHAKNFIAKNPSASAWSGGFAQLENGLLTQVKDFAVTLATQTPRDILDFYGVETRDDSATKKAAGGAFTVILAGVAIGAGIWYFTKPKKGA